MKNDKQYWDNLHERQQREMWELNNMMDEYDYEVRHGRFKPKRKQDKKPPSTKAIVITVCILAALAILAFIFPLLWIVFIIVLIIL